MIQMCKRRHQILKARHAVKPRKTWQIYTKTQPKVDLLYLIPFHCCLLWYGMFVCKRLDIQPVGSWCQLLF